MTAVGGEFRDPATEAAFQAERLPETERHARLLLVLSAILNALFLASDWRFAGTEHFLPAIGARLSIVALALLGLAALRRARGFAGVQGVMAAWCWLHAVAIAVLVSSRSDIALAVVFIVPAIYFLVVPAAFRWMVVTGAGCSALILAGYAMDGPPLSTAPGLALLMVLFDAALVLLVRRTNRLGRLEWAATRAERQANVELAASREMIERLFMAVPVPLVVTDLADGRLLRINHAAVEYFGADPKTLGIDSILQIYDDPSHRKALLQRLTAERHVTGFETRVRRSDGAPRDVLVAATRLDAGSDEALLAGIIDVTDLRRAEDAVRESNARLVEAQRVARLGNWELLADGGLAVSEECRALLGLEAGETIAAAAFLDAFHPDDRAAAAAVLRPLAGEAAEAECRLDTGGGEERVVHLRGEPAPRRRGAHIVRIGTLQDITERRRREAELRMLWEAVRQIPEGILVTAPDATIQYVNPALVNMTGYRPDEMIGATPRLFKSGLEGPSFYAEMWRTIAGGYCWTGEIRNRRRDGSRYWEQMTIAPVVGRDGRITNYIGIKADITERREMQDRIEHLAYHDMLTGLPNRSLLHERLKWSAALAERQKQAVALLYIDLDGFKAINDGLGHEAGDQVLKVASERLRRCLRQSDTLARLGGDEFVALLMVQADDPAAEAGTVATRMIEALRDPVPTGAGEATVGASIGIALHPRGGEDIESCLRLADQAMYRAKRQGKNRFVFYDEPGGG